MYTAIVSTSVLNELISNHTPFIIDARHDLMDASAGRAAYAAGHIRGAHFLHLDEDLSGQKTGTNGRHPLPHQSILADKLIQLGLSHNQQVIVYDANNGMMAARAWWLLRELGHEAVAVLDGGMAEWQKQGYDVSTEMPPISSTGTFSAHPSLNTSVTANEILAQLDDDHYTVIDARAPERYRGNVEPIDPVGGHIPHAINAFFMNNLNDDGTFKDAALLREQWQKIIGKKPLQQIVNQCGSGVTACHNILAQHIAGLKGAALYPGSWSEWCSDTSRPVATGND